ncbi:MAG: type 1 glutamine amidotransferase family protein [Planctomycetota bacterium]
MSYLDDSGNIKFEAPVSTLNDDSLERGKRMCRLWWPGQQGMYNFPMDQLARRIYEKDRITILSMREVLFHGKELDNSMRAASHDFIFGLRFTWPFPAKKGERYVFSFQGENPPQEPAEGIAVNNLELPDHILINGRRVWERATDEGLYFTVEYIASEDGQLEMTLLKDAMKTWRDADRGWGDSLPMVHATCRGYVHLHMGLNLACEHFGSVDKEPTAGEEYLLPEGLRATLWPGIWKWVKDEEVLDYKYPPVQSPAYPTDKIVINQFHDLYLDDPAFISNPDEYDHSGEAGLLWNNTERLQDIIRLSLENGIHSFSAYEPVLKALEEMGLQNDSAITIFFSGGYIKRLRGADTDTAEAQHLRRVNEGARLANVMRRFPNSKVIYRINEFSGCQYAHVITLPEDRARTWPKLWYQFSKAADEVNREALEDLLTEARSVDDGRLSVGANVQDQHLGSHPFTCGADFTIEKTIGRSQVNILIAHSRAVNTAHGDRIGMQHDAWGGLNYNRDSFREIESIHRSFFFNGADFMDAEFGNYGLDQETGRGVFTLKGMALIRITRLAAIHPRRGRQRVKLGFLKGSDSIWGWFYPSTHTRGLRGFNGYDPADPKEFIDFELLDITFPKFGTWHAWNPERWLTGTPYGPVNIVPWDASPDYLKEHKILVMLGCHRFEEKWLDNYIDYVSSGGTLVMGLYQLLAPGSDQVYFKQDVSKLLGIKLGEDVSLFPEMTSLRDRQTFQTSHYNRIELAGAEVIERLPNGDPLLTCFKTGKGKAYFFTTDRLKTVPNAAQTLITSLFEKNISVHLDPAHDQMEIAISEKQDLRIVTLLDHGRDCLPTDAGKDTGPYSGNVILDLDNLGLGNENFEVLEAVTDEKITVMKTKPVEYKQVNRKLIVQINSMNSYAELLVGPKDKTEKLFYL